MALRSALISRQPTAYTIILILRDISHEIIEYLDLACFVYLVLFVDVNLINKVSEQIVGKLGYVSILVHDIKETPLNE
jgi:hypothetical protein